METETARNRSAETWHGDAVRWFVDQIGNGRSKVQSRGGARRVRRGDVAVQQPELWPVHQTASETIAHESVLPQAPSAAMVDLPVEHMSFMPTVEKETFSRPRTLSRRIVSPAPRPVAPVARAGRSMARFLDANGTIEVMRNAGQIKFDLPDRALSKAFRFWRSSEVLTGFTPVYH